MRLTGVSKSLTTADVESVFFDGVAVGISFTGASTSLSRKSRKRIPDVHALKVFKFLTSGLRYLNTVIISEASDDSPRDIQPFFGKPKANRSVARGIVACLGSKLCLRTSAIRIVALL